MTEVRIRRKRKKKSSKGLWITLITLVILVGGGWGGYHLFTHKDVQAEDVGVDEDFFDFSDFEIESSDLPFSSNEKEEDKDSPDEKDKTKVNSGDSNKGTTTNSNNEKKNEEDNNIQPASDDKQQDQNSELKDLEKEIEGKYSATFKSLESAAISKIDTLAENALKDYKSGRPLSDLSSTYMSAVNKLQKKLDEVFNNQLKLLKEELKANGLDNDLAVQAKAEYEEAIAAKKSEMLNKVAKIK